MSTINTNTETLGLKNPYSNTHAHFAVSSLFGMLMSVLAAMTVNAAGVSTIDTGVLAIAALVFLAITLVTTAISYVFVKSTLNDRNGNMLFGDAAIAMLAVAPMFLLAAFVF